MNGSAHIYSQAGDIWVEIYSDNTGRPKAKENQVGILEISGREFTYFAGNSAEDLGSRK